MGNRYRAVLFDRAERLGWSCHEDDDGSVYFSQYSPAGEDFGFTVRGEDIATEVREYAEDFDPEEHIEMWVEAKKNGVRGVPSIRDLVHDADQIDEMLADLADGLESNLVIKDDKCPDCGEYVRRAIRFDPDGMPYWQCLSCGTIHEDRSWYRYISSEEASALISDGGERGRFVCEDGDAVIGIDNSTGDVWTEEFPDLLECLLWLSGETEVTG